MIHSLEKRPQAQYSAPVWNDKPDKPNLVFALQTLLIVLMAAVPYVTMAGFWPKFNRAEVFFAECAKEMLATDNLVTPLYHGQAFFDKPILVYWMILGSFQALGVSHLAARVPSIVCALITIAITAFVGARLFGKKAGLLAGAALASSFMFLSFANLCMSDTPLVLFDTITLALMYTATASVRWRNVSLWLCALSMGVAFLTKGPVGIVLPAISFALYLTITRQWRIVSPANAVICSAIVITAASPWFLAAYRENGLGALSYFFIRENLQRFAGSTYDTHRPIWFMLVSLIGGFAPWSVFLPAAAVRTTETFGRNRETFNKLLFLWLWTATVTLFFSVSRGKIDYYVLPVYPATSLLVAYYLTESFKEGGWFSKGVGWICAGAAFTAGALCAVAVPQLAPQLVPHLAPHLQDNVMLPCGLTLMALGGLMLLCMRGRLFTSAYVCVAAIVLSATTFFGAQAMPAIMTLHAQQYYMDEISTAAPDVRIGMHKAVENWIDETTFQTGKEPILIKKVQGVQNFLSASAPSLLVVPDAEYNQLPQDLRNRLRVLESHPFIGHSLSPGYFLKKRGNVTESANLLLVTNK